MALHGSLLGVLHHFELQRLLAVAAACVDEALHLSSLWHLACMTVWLGLLYAFTCCVHYTHDRTTPPWCAVLTCSAAMHSWSGGIHSRYFQCACKSCTGAI